MICLHARLPLLHFGHCKVTYYEASWIEQSISQAAADAGHEKWIFAEDVALGVIQYLREKFEGSSITLPELFKKIARTLDTIGFPDIAAALKAEPPQIEVSLSEIVHQSAPGFELLLFRTLEKRLRELRHAGVKTVRFTGLDDWLSHLSPPDTGNDGDYHQRELLAFLDHYAGSTSVPGERFTFKIG